MIKFNIYNSQAHMGEFARKPVLDKKCGCVWRVRERARETYLSLGFAGIIRISSTTRRERTTRLYRTGTRHCKGTTSSWTGG